MPVTHPDAKTYNAILYFLEHTSMCNKKKLFKLLFFFDFEHFAETGRSVTDNTYLAWDRGPVPVELHKKIKGNDAGLLEFVSIENTDDGEYKRTVFHPKKDFDERAFSRRQLKLLEHLSQRFAMMTGAEMEAFTHQPGSPWSRVYEDEGCKNSRIPYEYELDRLEDSERDAVLANAEDRNDFLMTYR
jgi:uncharacterized phage-associated protein